MRIRSMVIAAAMLTPAQYAASQSVGNMLKDDFKYAFRDIGAIWSSPFDASGKDWALAGASFGAFGLAMLGDQGASDWAIDVKDTWFFETIKPLRRGGWLFSGKYVVPPVAAMYVIGIAAKNQGMRDFVMGCMATWAAEGVPRKGIARLFGRARPDSLPDDPQNWKLGAGKDWMMRSFPAGHFANVLGCATFANKRFEMGVAEPLLYAVAAGVGVGRMADEAHWLSDTVIGGLLGYAVGSEIARRSLDRKAARAPSVNVSPGLGSTSVTVRWTF
jgi:membrane-associated phospholipid phosphatase